MSAAWITFDCFGTLIDWETGFTRLLQPLLGAKTAAVIGAYHLEERRLEAEKSHRPYKEVLVRALLLAARKVGASLTERQARGLPEGWGTLPLFPDVPGALRQLRRAGFRLAVLTNCDNDLFALTHRAFPEPFDRVVTAESAGGYKPALGHFRLFQEWTRASRRQWVHVANSLYHDLVPARLFGLRSIWLDRAGTSGEATPASAHLRSAAGLANAAGRLLPTPGQIVANRRAATLPPATLTTVRPNS